MAPEDMALSKMTNVYKELQLPETIAGNSLDEIGTGLENLAGSEAGFHPSLLPTGTKKIFITEEIKEQFKQLPSNSKEFQKLGYFTASLQNKCPRREGLPVKYISCNILSDYILNCESPDDITDEQLQQASYSIEVIDDYGILSATGLPVWDRMEGERIDFYNLFKLYRDSKFEQLDTGDLIRHNRTIAGLAKHLNVSAAFITTISKMYNWQTRIQYYDYYMDLKIYKRTLNSRKLMEDKQVDIALHMMEVAKNVLQNDNNISPAEAIKMMELAFKTGRINLGLEGDKPSNGIENAGSDGSAQPFPSIQGQNLNIHVDNSQKTVNHTENTQNVNLSQVEQAFSEDLKENDNILSILNVLEKSGAVKQALGIHDEEINAADDYVDIETLDDLEEETKPAQISVEAVKKAENPSKDEVESIAKLVGDDGLLSFQDKEDTWAPGGGLVD